MFRQFGMICVAVAAIMLTGRAMAAEKTAQVTPGTMFEGIERSPLFYPVPPLPEVSALAAIDPIWVFNGKKGTGPLPGDDDIAEEVLKRIFGCKRDEQLKVWCNVLVEDQVLLMAAEYVWTNERRDGRRDTLEVGLGGNIFIMCGPFERSFDGVTLEQVITRLCTENGVAKVRSFRLAYDEKDTDV